MRHNITLNYSVRGKYATMILTCNDNQEHQITETFPVKEGDNREITRDLINRINTLNVKWRNVADVTICNDVRSFETEDDRLHVRNAVLKRMAQSWRGTERYNVLFREEKTLTNNGLQKLARRLSKNASARYEAEIA